MTLSGILNQAILVGSLCLAVTSFGEPSAPLTMKDSSGACFSMREICGDGIDQDCDGSDLLCPAPDRDRDGSPEGQDCDDTDRRVRPGVRVACQASCGNGTRVCGTGGGQYSSCSCSPVCEAIAPGKCYYVSRLIGDDSNPGTFERPWRSQSNFVSYYDPANRPARWVQLAPGDVVYFLSGRYDQTYTYGDGRYQGVFRNTHGTAQAPITIASYPGAAAVFAPRERAVIFYVLQSSNINVRGLELSGGYGNGIKIAESSRLELADLWIHDTDGIDNDNIAGLGIIDGGDISIHHSVINDNYDRENSDTGGNKTENSRNAVFFRGGNIRYYRNITFNSLPISSSKGGGGVTYKHSASIQGSLFHVEDNVFFNCSSEAIGSGSFGTRILNNLVVDSGPISIRDFGGPTFNRDIVIARNTIIGGAGLLYNPTLSWGAIGSLIYRNNVVVDSMSQTNERAIITIDPYGPDSEYAAVALPGNLALFDNCYYSAQAPKFLLFNMNGGSYGVNGQTYSFSGWQGAGYDVRSIMPEVNLNNFDISEDPNCQSSGWSSRD